MLHNNKRRQIGQPPFYAVSVRAQVAALAAQSFSLSTSRTGYLMELAICSRVLWVFLPLRPLIM